MLTPSAVASMATPTGSLSSKATPASTSAPGASGTNHSWPLTRRSSPPAARGAGPRSSPCSGSVLHCSRASSGGATGRYAARRSPLASASSWSATAGDSLRMAVAGRWPSSATPASTRPHSPITSIASKASRPAPPWASSINSPGQPASMAVGHRSGRDSFPSRASRAASSVLKRDSAPRAASRRKTCSSDRARFISVAPSPRARRSCGGGFLGAQLGEGNALVEPRSRWEPEHALTDRVAQNLLGPAGGLQPGQEGDHVRPLALLRERVGPHHVGDQVTGADRVGDDRHLREPRLGARNLAFLQGGERPVAGEADRQQLARDLAQFVAHLGVGPGAGDAGDRAGEAGRVVAQALAAEADRHALEHQRRQSGRPAVAHAADHRLRVERDVVEENLVELRL